MGNLEDVKPINQLIIEIDGNEYVFTGGSSGPLPPDSVGTEQIIDGAVEEEDLHDDVKDRMTITHDSSTNGLRIGGYAKPGEVPVNNSQDVGQGGSEDTDDDDQPGGGFNDPMLEEEGD